MKTAHLFAGIGGVALAARWAGHTPTWVADVEPYASRILAKNFPGVPNHGDVRLIDASRVEPVDFLSGGFPCQDISLAGKGAGITGARSGLWTEFHRLIGDLRPRYALIENVAALRSRGLDVVLRDLDAIGYDAEWHCIPASAVGAPHQRDRIWIVAHPADERPTGWLASSLSDGDDDGRGWGAQHHRSAQPELWENGTPGLDAHGSRDGVPGGGDGARPASDPRAPQEWWAAEPGVGRVADGVPGRVDRLRGLGNSCVPLIPYLIYRAIDRYEALAEGV